MADLDKIFNKNPEMLLKQKGRDNFLIDPYRRCLIVLDPVAFVIWNLLDGKRTVRDIIKIVNDEFEVDPEVLRSDIQDFIGQLVRREIVL